MFTLKNSRLVLNLTQTGRSVERFLATQTQLNVNDDLQTSLPFEEIPRPKFWEVVRDFMPTGKFYDSSITDYNAEMRKRYGDIFVMPGMFGKKDIVVSFNTADCEKVFRNEGQFPIREGLDSVTHFRQNVKGEFFGEVRGLISLQGEDWLKLRSAVNPILMKPQNLKMYMKPLFDINNEFIERIKEIRSEETLEMPANFEEELNRLAFEGISVIALNRELGLIRRNRDNPDALKLFVGTRDIFTLIYKLDIEPSIWKVIRTPNYYASMRAQEDVFDITSKFVNETLETAAQKQSEGQDAEAVSVLERLIAVEKKVAVVMAMDMLFAGVDATSSTLSGILLCLAKNPEKQNKLREEIMSILPSKETELTEDKMKNLPYLRAVIKESMRYYPNVAGPLRTNSCDLSLSGYHIPKGTNLLLNNYMHMQDDKYYPQASEFVPERWLRSSESKSRGSNPFTFIPFGFGPRICVGKRIVEMEMEITLAKLIRNFYVDFNYSVEKPFRTFFINMPAIPLKFKFSDVQN